MGTRKTYRKSKRSIVKKALKALLKLTAKDLAFWICIVLAWAAVGMMVLNH